MARDEFGNNWATDPSSDNQSSRVGESRQNIEQWLQNMPQVTTEDEAPLDVDADNEEEPDFQEYDPPYPSILGQYRHLVLASVAYRWLLESLTAVIKLSVEGDDFRAHLRSDIAACFGGRTIISRKRSSEYYSMIFLADWNPMSFLHNQFPNDVSSVGRLLGEVPTLTGSVASAQMLTCADYLSQTWPSTGPSLLELLKTAAMFDESVSGRLDDDTQIRVLLKENCIEVKVDGTVASIGEVGEQIAWIGAALRSPGGNAGLTTCRPHIHTMKGGVLQPPICTIFYKAEIQDLKLPPGQCLRSITKNVALVPGFPILTGHTIQLRQSVTAENHSGDTFLGNPFAMTATSPMGVSLRARVTARKRLQQGRIIDETDLNLFCRVYTPHPRVSNPLVEEVLLHIFDQLQYLDRGFAYYFPWVVDSDRVNIRQELEDIRRGHAKAQNAGDRPGSQQRGVVLGDLGDFCEQVVRAHAEISPEAARNLRYEVTYATVRDKMCYLQNAHEAPYWKLMLEEFGSWHTNNPGLEAWGIMKLIQSTRLGIMADLAKLQNQTKSAAATDDLMLITNGIEVRLGVLNDARDGSPDGLRSLQDLIHKFTSSPDPTLGASASDARQTSSPSTILSIAAISIFFALATTPFAVGFAKASKDGQVGSFEDADFWFLSSGNVMTTLGSVLVVVLCLVRGKRIFPVYLSVWLFIGLGLVCSAVSLAIYTRVHSGWSTLFVLFGSFASVVVTFILSLEDAGRDAEQQSKLKAE